MTTMKSIRRLFLAAAFAKSNLRSRWLDLPVVCPNHIPRHHRNRSKYKPHQGEREKLRRRVGGFSQFRKAEGEAG